MRQAQFLKFVSSSSGIEACQVADGIADIVVQELLVTMGRHVLRYKAARHKTSTEAPASKTPSCEMENTQSTLDMLLSVSQNVASTCVKSEISRFYK